MTNFIHILGLAIVGFVAQAVALAFAKNVEGDVLPIAIGMATSGATLVGAAAGIATSELRTRRKKAQGGTGKFPVTEAQKGGPVG